MHTALANQKNADGANRLIPVFIALAAAVLLAIAVLAVRRGKQPPREVLRSELVNREGRLYLQGSDSPFTGLMIERYPDGQLQSRSMVSHGVLDGVSEGWFTNGTLQVREPFRSGVSHGIRTKWHMNGATQATAAIVEGKLHGAFRRWYESGQLAEEVLMKEGQPDGESVAYYPNGQVKARARLQDGKVIEQKHFDENGETRPALTAAKGSL